MRSDHGLEHPFQFPLGRAGYVMDVAHYEAVHERRLRVFVRASLLRGRSIGSTGFG